MKIVFDIETIGFPIFKNNSNSNAKELYDYDKSRIVQLAWIVMSEDNKELHRRNFIVKPDGFVIENENIHGISQDRALKTGLPIKNVISFFEDDLRDTSLIISHNMGFDFNVLSSEMHRAKMLDCFELFNSKQKYCTMLKAQEKLYLQKYPKLVELYDYYFSGTEPKWKQIHDAMDDVVHCMKCYIKLTEKDIK